MKHLQAAAKGAMMHLLSVEFDLKFRRTNPMKAGLVQVLVFNAEQLSRRVATVHGRRQYCCTASLAALGHCAWLCRGGHHRRARAASSDRPHRCSAECAAPSPSPPNQRAQRPLRCQPVRGVHLSTGAREAERSALPAALELRLEDRRRAVSGQTTWRNPHGYLPAELYPFLPFFGLLTAAYVLLCLFWALSCLRHWSALLPLQSAIAVVLLLSVVESATWFASYRAFNDGGTRGLVPTVLGVLISTVRKTVARLLVLTVCLGYGVVRPTLGSTFHRIVLLGGFYFLTALSLDVAANVTSLEELALPTRLLFVLPVSLMDALYFLVVRSALSRTLSQLSSRRQSAKLLLYRRFSHVLFGTLFVSALCVVWQMAFIVSDNLDTSWHLLWTFDAFWHVPHACVLLTICALWSPSRNNQQYAYMDELGQEAPDEDGDGDGDGDSISGDEKVKSENRVRLHSPQAAVLCAPPQGFR